MVCGSPLADLELRPGPASAGAAALGSSAAFHEVNSGGQRPGPPIASAYRQGRPAAASPACCRGRSRPIRAQAAGRRTLCRPASLPGALPGGSSSLPGRRERRQGLRRVVFLRRAQRQAISVPMARNSGLWSFQIRAISRRSAIIHRPSRRSTWAIARRAA
jgi:hypothetical protein